MHISTNVVIPMAGLGSRFSKNGFQLPKPLIKINDQAMIIHAIRSLDIPGNYYFLIRENEFFEETKKILLEEKPDCVILSVQETTEGAAVSALKFKEYIDNDNELIITNCDQIMQWNASVTLETLRKFDGGVVTITSCDPKHSYVKINANNLAEQLVEKQVISDHALTGIHYWKRGSDFVRSAESMINNNDRSANGEFYVAPTYNYLINEGLKISTVKLADNEFFPVGTPDDLERYLNESRQIS
jgi:dTDP-glucose pyrophosphorylase